MADVQPTGTKAMYSEPAITVGAIGSLIGAGLTLLTAFGISITAEQQAAILGFAAIALPIVSALVIRSKVFSQASVDTIISDTVKAERGAQP